MDIRSKDERNSKNENFPDIYVISPCPAHLYQCCALTKHSRGKILQKPQGYAEDAIFPDKMIFTSELEFYGSTLFEKKTKKKKQFWISHFID